MYIITIKTKKKMRTRFFMSMAAAAMILAGCSNEENEAVDNWNGEIRLSSGLVVQQVTRSIETDKQSTQIAENNHVGFFINEDVTESPTTTYTQNLDYTADGGGNFTGTTVYYPQSGKGVNIYAYAPWKDGLTLDGNYPFTVKTDQSEVNAYIASDLLWGQPMKEETPDTYITANPVARTKTPVPVTFKHLLSKIEVTLKVGKGLTVDHFKGATLTILNTKPTTNLTLKDGNISEASGIPTDIIAASYGQETTSATLTAAAIVVPQTITKGTKFMKLHLTTGGDLYYTLPNGSADEDLLLESGKIYKYEITVNLTGLTVTSTINDWETIGNGNPVKGEATME